MHPSKAAILKTNTERQQFMVLEPMIVAKERLLFLLRFPVFPSGSTARGPFIHERSRSSRGQWFLWPPCQWDVTRRDEGAGLNHLLARTDDLAV